MSDDIQRRAVEWMARGDKGSSSEAIWTVMMGARPKSRFCYPSDTDDFGRCHRLLSCIPEWRERITEMRDVGPQWAALASAWPELTALYEAQKHDELYSRMQEVLRDSERGDKDIIIIGNGMRVYRERAT